MILIPVILTVILFGAGMKITDFLVKELTDTKEVKELKIAEYPVNKTEDLNKYIKVTYKSDPIGQRGIILYLTTFDIEAYKRDKSLLEVPEKEERVYVSLPDRDISIDKDIPIRMLEDRLNEVVRKHYDGEIKKLKQLLREEREDTTCNTQYLLNKQLARQRREMEIIQNVYLMHDREDWSDW